MRSAGAEFMIHNTDNDDELQKISTVMTKKKLITILTIVGFFSGLQLLAAQTGLFSNQARVATQRTAASLAKQKSSLPASGHKQQRQHHPTAAKTALDRSRLTAFKAAKGEIYAAIPFSEPETISTKWGGNKSFAGRIPDIPETARSLSSNPAVFFQQPAFIGHDDPGTGMIRDSTPLFYYLAEPGTPSSGLPPFWMLPGDNSGLIPGGQENPHHQVVPIPASFLLFASGLLVIICLKKITTETKTILIEQQRQLSHRR